ncbi:hypothetical protein IFM89_004339 [Coptis chinensis]|uniref:Uncharacterized protein n=1 Tax=Coptis chinensis TaxID=261450 RepID=A0A835LYF7_9MAGN|nr:hypothetical protein IFM89_004339 [Coptis chinensis]
MGGIGGVDDAIELNELDRLNKLLNAVGRSREPGSGVYEGCGGSRWIGLLVPSITQLMFLCGWLILGIDFLRGIVPKSENLSTLVLVFDMNEPSSFATLHDFVSETDIQKFEILLCIGNKVDLLTGHLAHSLERPGTVSCADIVALSAKDSVSYQVPSLKLKIKGVVCIAIQEQSVVQQTPK